METYLRRRDLPSFCRAFNPNSPRIQLVLKEAQTFSRAQGHILNTFDKLEGEFFTHMQALCPNLYNIGPLHLNLKCRIKQESAKSFSNSLWQEDRSCLGWLDAQPQKSVLFVSIGSLAVMTKDQLMEIWCGLINSKTRFLWVRRADSIIKSNNEEADQSQYSEVPSEVIEGIKDRGCIVRWAPQEEVLAHKAIGGFLTHSGWNSTLESIVAGVPMICWPFFVDQQVNSRVVSEVWKIGLDMKDNCNRVVIEKMIKDLMGTRKDEFLARADEMGKLAAQAVVEDGSSYNSLNRLIDDIMFMRFSIQDNVLLD